MAGGAAVGPNAARVINQVTHGLGSMGIWVRLPLMPGGPLTAEEAAVEGEAEEEEESEEEGDEGGSDMNEAVAAAAAAAAAAAGEVGEAE